MFHFIGIICILGNHKIQNRAKNHLGPCLPKYRVLCCNCYITHHVQNMSTTNSITSNLIVNITKSIHMMAKEIAKRRRIVMNL
jgi:hypothetical protein